jgi:hypothetical protein
VLVLELEVESEPGSALESVLVPVVSAAEPDEDPLSPSLAEVVIVTVGDVPVPEDEPGRDVATTELLGAAESDFTADWEGNSAASARASEGRRRVVRTLVCILLVL